MIDRVWDQLAPAFSPVNTICPLETTCAALLSNKPPSSGTTLDSHERSRMATLPILRRAVLGFKPQDRFFRVIYWGRIVHRGDLLLGTVSRFPDARSVSNPRF